MYNKVIKSHSTLKHKNQDITGMLEQMFPQNNQTKEITFYRNEKLLLESDPFSLEQQRYLNRLRNSEMVQKNNYEQYHSNVFLPEITKRMHREQYEQNISRERLQQQIKYQRA
jgi:ATP-dependent protease HslVU (ClpYQ) ATPase subunit